MFEKLRQSLRDAMSGQSAPARTALMREALIEAKVGLSRVREARDATAQQLARERAELETVQRRGRLASQINDAETVRIASQFEQKHVQRLAMLEHKLASQSEELALAEGEVAEMTAQLRAMASGIEPPGAGAAAVEEPEGAEPDFSALRRQADRTAREAEAERQLAELKRRMGK